ncbi:hypothetical protein O1L60_01020 [Streptomyces diastatochromogenes]|nr:hypothetical protein [Streptomyces diastatochromogenes]
MLHVSGDAGAVRPPRYRMARAARDFGTERLAAAGELPVTRDRHAAHFAARRPSPRPCGAPASSARRSRPSRTSTTT